MRERFWQGPGPQGVVSDVREALLRGDSVVFRQPQWAPDLIEPLSAGFPPQRPWFEIDDTLCRGRQPDAVLRASLGLPSNAPLLDCAPPHAEPVAVVRGAVGERLRSWARLVRRHHHATREVMGAVRLLLLAPAEIRLEREEVGGAMVREWRDVVGRLDMHLYAALLWRGRTMNLLERDLCVAQTRELAGFCPELAERLAAAGPQAAFEPAAVLSDLGQDRGWGAQTVSDWANGTKDLRDGIEIVHAALAAAHGDERDTRRRLWRAQIEVLFPVVELVRFELACRYQGLLQKVPDEENGGFFEPEDVDVGPLAHRLMTASGVREQHRTLAAAIRDIRRSMAHRRPVSRAQALHPALVRVVEDGMQIGR